ncbi:ABC transporter ATP-binding protein [Burkholderia ubonensis]|uniref:ABC transporter ATP-binding protein n=1 Tax=Burkholderia ubonensis TaxID=101571 RepID=UPI0007529F1D|nr:ATP-binding cassette domain-containing protein [Burkholderia ubonensis]KVQ89442.1 ABC transporter [Burkholderia ubonensis]
MTQPLIALRGVTCRFGDVCAVDGLDLDVAQGETVGLIGPNGSGKSTTLGLVAGTLRPTAGTIRLAGADVTRVPAWRRVALGIAWTSQQPRVFERLSVRDNLAAAGRDAADAALHDAALAHRRHALAATLTFAERRRLELARALALRPRVLLVDEPASGLDADELATLRERLAALRARGVAIVLVEHRVGFVAQLAERIVVLEHGRVLAAGTPAHVLADPAVCRAYLGAHLGAHLGDTPAPHPVCAAA